MTYSEAAALTMSVEGLAGISELEAYQGWAPGAGFDVDRLDGARAVVLALLTGVDLHALFATTGLSVLRREDRRIDP